jgi:hypothetical protein
MATLKTLLSVTDSTGNDTFSFMVTHSHGVNAATAVIHAFNEYAKTPAGKKYIKNNGSNWE